MRAIFRKLVSLAPFAAGWYALAWAGSHAVFPSPELIDTFRAGDTLFRTEPKLIAMSAGALARTLRPKLIVLGSSNAGEGLRAPMLQAVEPDYEVHDLAIGGSNCTEMREVADLAFEEMTPDVARRSVFVIGVWYGLFADNHAVWDRHMRQGGRTSIEIEKDRWGLYRVGFGGHAPIMGPAGRTAFVELLRPCLFAIECRSRAEPFVAALIEQNRFDQSLLRVPPLRHKPVRDDERRRAFHEYWWNYVGRSDGTLSGEQFDELRELCRTIASHGSRAFLVDLPIPDWHREGSPFVADYRRRMDAVVDGSARGGLVSRIDLSDLTGEFIDSTHPTRAFARIWCLRLHERLHDTPTPLLAGNISD